MASDSGASQFGDRGRHTEPAAIGVRYFLLYDDLAAPTSGTPSPKALAYPCRYDREQKKWIALTSIPVTRLGVVYNAPRGHAHRGNHDGGDGEIVECVWLAGSQRWELLEPASAAMYRGLTDADLDKGNHGNVKRYVDGTDDDSGKVDDVYNDFIDVGHPKVCIYVKIGTKFYLIAVECPPK